MNNVKDGVSVKQSRTQRPISQFKSTFLELEAHGLPKFAQSSTEWTTRMPHPFRKIAKDRPVYAVPLIVFQDDVSGNQSKQWNKHYNIYMSNAALPREVLDKEFSTRFVATSQHVPPLEMMRGLRKSVE